MAKISPYLFVDYRTGPKVNRFVPAEDKCQALIKGDPKSRYVWRRQDYQCCRIAVGSRAGHIACWQHLLLENVTWTILKSETSGTELSIKPTQ